ncbi:helix-turn-helix domain-containing protein [Gorillibacterium massiliense]|uniref:helix-turn-helix domain-containing protein n=1 Tax=Gorillibacterium massiliense TaxID=1280390 RepID=UPI0005935404|nr:helix-turn-helix transcriptional regulator [Gorillibacterium massiliense]
MNNPDIVLRLVGLRIKEIRKAQSLSQEELGEKAGFHFSYIGSVERGEANITLKNLARISSSLNVSVAELLRYQESSDRYINESKELHIAEIIEILMNQDDSELIKIRNIIKEVIN